VLLSGPHSSFLPAKFNVAAASFYSSPIICWLLLPSLQNHKQICLLLESSLASVSPVSSCLLYGVFIAERVERMGEKGSADATTADAHF
jgi:hypothetical protein